MLQAGIMQINSLFIKSAAHKNPLVKKVEFESINSLIFNSRLIKTGGLYVIEGAQMMCLMDYCKNDLS